MSRTRNSAWTLAAGFCFSAASAAAGLVAPPLLLRWLGAEQFGAYRTLADWVGIVTYVDFGLAGALMAALAMRIGRADVEGTERVLAAGVRAYKGVVVAQLLAALALLILLPRVIVLSTVSVSELRVAAAIALSPILVSPLLAFRALAEARQRGYLSWLLMTLQVLTMTALALVLARTGWGLAGQCLALAAAQIPTVLLLRRDGLHAYPRALRVEPTPSDVASLRSLSWPTFAHSLTDRVGFTSDSIIIAWLLGPAAVVPFVLTQQIANLVQSQLRGIGAATWAGLAELSARGDHASFRDRLLELTSATSGLGLAVLIPVAVYNRTFVSLWVEPQQYAGDLVTVLACFDALLWSIFALWGWAILGSGHIRRWVPFAVLSTAVNVAVSIIATWRLGLAGPLLGTAAGLVLVSAWALPRVLAESFGIPTRSLWKMAVTPLLWAVPYAAALWFVTAHWPPRTWLALFSMAALAGSSGLLCLWVFGLDAGARRTWLARASSWRAGTR